MKEKNKFIVAIVAVVAIIALVTSATFAYWQWVSANNTLINFIVNGNDVGAGNLSASINGNGTTTVSSLQPAECTNSNYALKKTVTINYENQTARAATVTANLKVTAFQAGIATSSSTAFSNLKWALTASSTSCTPATGDLSGTFSGLTFSSSKSPSNLPYTLATPTISVPAKTTSSKTYTLWVWIDKNYTSTNTGTTVSDPLQNMTFTLQWSGQIAQNS